MGRRNGGVELFGQVYAANRGGSDCGRRNESAGKPFLVDEDQAKSITGRGKGEGNGVWSGLGVGSDGRISGKFGGGVFGFEVVQC